MASNETAVNPVRFASRRRFLRNALASMCVLGSGIEYARAYEPNDLEVVPVTVSLPNAFSAPSNLRIGLLSDMHCDSEHACRRTERAVHMLLAERPDVVFLTGDYITLNAQKWAPECARSLEPLLSVPRGVYAVLGNHDWGPTGDPDRADLVAQCLTGVGLTVLRNASSQIPNTSNTWVVGLDDLCFDRQDVSTALEGVPASAVKILLVHEPDYADQSPDGFALQLSGHSHGGQVRFPGLPPVHLPQFAAKYYEGLYHTKSHIVYTTRGVGTVGLPLRAFCRPEVTIINLSFEA